MTRLTVKQKLAEQAAGVVYGCHVDGEDEVDGTCVIDNDDRFSCIYGNDHRTREGCPHWRRMKGAGGDVRADPLAVARMVLETATVETPAALLEAARAAVLKAEMEKP